MDPVFPYEERLANAIRELRESPITGPIDEYVEPAEDENVDVDRVFQGLADDGHPIDRRMQRCYFRYKHVALEWNIEDGEDVLAGEFDLINIAAIPDLPVPADYFTRDGLDLQFLSELYVIDDLSASGTGSLAAMRLQDGVADPEIWFLDGDRTYVKLDLGYCEYLDGLLVSKGVYGWQYLFADVELGEYEFGPVLDNLRWMLDIFPEQFPEHDYAPLVARLEARLAAGVGSETDGDKNKTLRLKGPAGEQ